MRGALFRGFSANLLVSVSVAAYGSVLGVLAAQKQISWAQLLLMNLSVFAGSAQFVMVEMWIPPLPIVEMTLAVLAINFRYLLIGASLEPLFHGRSLWVRAACMHLVADENWAITMASLRRNGRVSPLFLFGGGLCILLSWCCGTLIGCFFGAAIHNPQDYALDFAFVAVFTALAASLWRGKRDIIPWIAAACTAIMVERMWGGKWYVVVGAVVGALTAVVVSPDEERDDG